MVENHIRERNRYKANRAKAVPLFNCYCVNMFQLQKIKKFLETTIPYFSSVFKYSIGYKIMV